jgi:hypothetical protein
MSKRWAQFVRDDWNKRPAVLSGLPDAPLLSISDVFEGFVSAAETSRSGEWIDARFYVDGSIVVTDREQYLPRSEDEALNGYLDRLRSSLPGRSCCFVIRDFHMYQPKLFESLRELFRDLYARIGTPEDTVVSLFVGDYRRTPFGIHIDNDHTFYCVLEGQKDMFLWPPEYAERRRTPWLREGGLGSTADAQYRADATRLTARQGQILYWPPRFWHCAEGPPGNMVAISLGVAPQGPPFVADLLHQWILAETKFRDLTGHHRGHTVPTTFGRQIGIVRKHWPSLDKYVAEAWLQRKSSGGFRRTPSPRKRVRLRSSDLVSAKEGALSWVKDRKAKSKKSATAKRKTAKKGKAVKKVRRRRMAVAGPKDQVGH